MVRRLRSAIGTVEQADTPVICTLSAASRPRYISPSSSAVDRASVFTRQECTSFSPSKVASTVLVFPMSIHSSTETNVVRRHAAPPVRIGLPAAAQVERDVQDRGRVGQPADREVVHTGQRVLAG